MLKLLCWRFCLTALLFHILLQVELEKCPEEEPLVSLYRCWEVFTRSLWEMRTMSQTQHARTVPSTSLCGPGLIGEMSAANRPRTTQGGPGWLVFDSSCCWAVSSKLFSRLTSWSALPSESWFPLHACVDLTESTTTADNFTTSTLSHPLLLLLLLLLLVSLVICSAGMFYSY